jgi:hypothetical protein
MATKLNASEAAVRSLVEAKTANEKRIADLQQWLDTAEAKARKGDGAAADGRELEFALARAKADNEELRSRIATLDRQTQSGAHTAALVGAAAAAAGGASSRELDDANARIDKLEDKLDRARAKLKKARKEAEQAAEALAEGSKKKSKDSDSDSDKGGKKKKKARHHTAFP